MKACLHRTVCLLISQTWRVVAWRLSNHMKQKLIRAVHTLPSDKSNQKSKYTNKLCSTYNFYHLKTIQLLRRAANLNPISLQITFYCPLYASHNDKINIVLVKAMQCWYFMQKFGNFQHRVLICKLLNSFVKITNTHKLCNKTHTTTF